jgi:hypothetical protein
MSNKPDTLLVHGVSANIMNNASKFSHNSICGHFHSSFGVSYHADKAILRWAMVVGCLMDPNSPAARYGSKAILKRPVLGCGLLLSNTKRWLVISDLHLPYQHRDAFEFLKEVYDAYECNAVLNVGDLYDHHAGSYHESEPDAYGPEEEYALSKKYAAELQGLFPNMIITNGNHCDIPKRKLKSAGLPSSMLSDYNQLYNTKDTWVWSDQYWFDSKGAMPIVVPMRMKSNGRWDRRI